MIKQKRRWMKMSKMNEKLVGVGVRMLWFAKVVLFIPTMILAAIIGSVSMKPE
jgi:hypothetical protein